MWPSEDSIAALFENGELSFLDIKIGQNTETNYTLDFYSDSNREKEIYFGERETARLRDLSTTAIF